VQVQRQQLEEQASKPHLCAGDEAVGPKLVSGYARSAKMEIPVVCTVS